MRQATILSGAILIGLTAASGCRPPVPPAEAEGVVTYDGKPVSPGIISFIPVGGDGRATGGGAVLDGKYHVYPQSGLAPGKYRVEIRWGKPTGEKKVVGYGQSPDVIVEGLPPKYHADSVLTAELQSGPNTIDFRLGP